MIQKELKDDPNRMYNGFKGEAYVQAIGSEIRYRTKLSHVILEGLSTTGSKGEKYIRIPAKTTKIS